MNALRSPLPMKTDPAIHTISFGTRSLEFVLTRSERKRLRIVVEPDLTVRVAATIAATDKDVLTGVQVKASWIVRNLEHMRDYHPLPAPKQYIGGESFIYLGRQYRLKVLIGPTALAKFKGGYLEVSVPDKGNIKAGQRQYQGRTKSGRSMVPFKGAGYFQQACRNLSRNRIAAWHLPAGDFVAQNTYPLG